MGDGFFLAFGGLPPKAWEEIVNYFCNIAGFALDVVLQAADTRVLHWMDDRRIAAFNDDVPVRPITALMR